MARKVTDGEIRNKERTKLKLINAVGEIIRTQGYTKLGVNNIANTADVDKKLIYRYFDNVDNLIEIWVKNKDYWILLNNTVTDLIEEHNVNNGQELASDILEAIFNHLQNEPESQKILLWEISEKSKLMGEISATREKMGSELFAMTDPIFEKSDVDIRSIYALLLGGIYYMVLHSNATGGQFCEVDISLDEGKSRITKSLHQVMNWAFKEAGTEQEKLYRSLNDKAAGIINPIDTPPLVIR